MYIRVARLLGRLPIFDAKLGDQASGSFQFDKSCTHVRRTADLGDSFNELAFESINDGNKARSSLEKLESTRRVTTSSAIRFKLAVTFECIVQCILGGATEFDRPHLELNG